MEKFTVPSVVSMSLCEPLVEIRSFGWGRVVAGKDRHRYLLIVQERGNPEHTIYLYDGREEYQRDLLRVRAFRDGDDGMAGTLAFLAPTPPGRAAGAEEPIPDEP